MDDKAINNKITSGLIWTYLERLMAQGVSTVVTIILARLLMPEDYGVISIVTIFITIADALVIGGFSDTLIQKSDADQYDFSTLFWFVLLLGFVMYGIVFFIAPFIEVFFNTSLVATSLRVMSICIPISSIKSIQSAYISKNMKYKYFFFATLIGTVISAIIGIIMAYCGMGVWALVAQYLSNSAIDTCVIWFTCGWRPSFIFDINRLKILYSFGWKLQISTLLSTIYSEMESFCIGKKYTSADLAYFDKGRQFPKLIMHNVQTSVSKVMLPAFSLVQSDKDKMKSLARKSVRTCSYVMSPLLIGLIFCAKEFVSVILTDKWLPSVPFLQLLAIYYLCEPIMSVNKQIVIASGESKKYLYMEIEKKAIGIILLILALLFSNNVITIAITIVITQLISLHIQSTPTSKLIGYSLYNQLIDIIPSISMSLIMLFPIIFIKQLNISYTIKLVFEILSGAFIYLILSIFTKNNEFNTLLNFIKKMINKK